MNEFSLDIRQFDGEWHISLYDQHREHIGGTEGSDVGSCIRHAIYEANPVIAAACWPDDHFDWSESHDYTIGDEDEVEMVEDESFTIRADADYKFCPECGEYSPEAKDGSFVCTNPDCGVVF
jgi:hypothetical protein